MNFFHPMNIKTRRLISSEDLREILTIKNATWKREKRCHNGEEESVADPAERGEEFRKSKGEVGIKDGDNS